jgi:serine protease Do
MIEPHFFLRHGGLIAVPLAAALLLFAPAGLVQARTDAAATLNQDIGLLERESKARAAIAKEASSPVVNITVEKKASAEQTSSPEPHPPFNDQFMRRFFQGQIPDSPRDPNVHGLGTGIIVSAQGYVLTNNHVVADADKITVRLPDGRVFPAKRVGTDPATDVAVLKIEGKDFPVAKLGDSDEIEVGESVLAIGNPFGLDQTITAGIISAKGRNQVGVAEYENFIQTDASINPGNSGGPLLNLKGEVVGVNTAIFGNSGGNMGIGFAIPINQARSVMKTLIADGKVVRGFLGVSIQEAGPELAAAMSLAPDQKVLVSGVGSETPAAKAGLKQGDVILSFRGKAMPSVNALRYAVANVKPGETVPVEVLRDGKQLSLSVKIAEQPKDMVAATSGAPGGPADRGSADAVLGMKLRTLSPELAAQVGAKSDHGVVIADVDSNGPAAAAGLHEGDVLLEVNHHPVRTVREVREEVGRAPAKKYVLMLVQSGHADRYVAGQNG